MTFGQIVLKDFTNMSDTFNASNVSKISAKYVLQLKMSDSNNIINDIL